jgi:protein-disulfide isomerase
MGPVDEEDLTRKQRREQARSERKALEEAEAAGAARRKRLTQLGAVAAVVVVAIVIILIASGGGSGGGGKVETGKKAGGLVNKVEAEVGGGIPQNGNTIGAPAAPVTLQYFGDLQCPICKDFTLGALPTLLQKWVRAGKLRIEYRSLETATREPEEFKTQQVAALAAGKQNKMWQYIELFYNQQGEESSGYVTEKFLQGLAQQVPGLNLTQWTSDRGSATLNNQIAADAQAANNAGFTGTPSFLIGKTGGKMDKFEYASLTDPKSFNEAVEKVLTG